MKLSLTIYFFVFQFRKRNTFSDTILSTKKINNPVVFHHYGTLGKKWEVEILKASKQA